MKVDGKSTLCKAILGLIDFQGKITINNMNREKASIGNGKKRAGGISGPYGALNPKKTIGFILEEPLKIHKIGTKKNGKDVSMKYWNFGIGFFLSKSLPK